MYNEQRLIQLVQEKALEFGDFTLASGQKASFYLDCRRVTLDGEGANLIAHGILDRIHDDLPDAVGGMAIGADPITAAVVTVAWQRGLSLNGFIVRKQPKGHGKGQSVEGPVRAGQRVVIVEDVTTTGGSSLAAVERCREFGLAVDRVISIVDRSQGADELFRSNGVEFESLLNLADLGVSADSHA
jgi:orotate phosphoribosyltransferase